MKRTLIPATLIVLTIALTVLWFLRGYDLRDPDASGSTFDARSTSTASNDAVRKNAASVGAERANDSHSSVYAERSLRDSSTIGGGGSAPAAGPAQTGPQPLSAEGESRIAAQLELLRQAGSWVANHESLFDSEEADPEWSRRVEALLGEAILRHAGLYTGLELSPPRCTRSVCRLAAVGTSPTLPVPADQNFQQLVLRIMNEPWFMQEFMDSGTSNSRDERGPISIVYFVRR